MNKIYVNIAFYCKISKKILYSFLQKFYYKNLQIFLIGTVDEGQFFPDLVEYVEKWANRGKIVIVAALDANYKREPFGNVIELLPLAETIKKLSAVCLDCGKKASFSKRITENKTEKLIGGLNEYKVVCRPCYYKNE